MFAVKLANFLIFTVSEVKCLEGSSDIFGNGRTSSLVVRNLRQSSGIVSSLRKSILAFLESFWLLSGKIYNCFKEFFTVKVQNAQNLTVSSVL